MQQQARLSVAHGTVTRQVQHVVADAEALADRVDRRLTLLSQGGDGEALEPDVRPLDLAHDVHGVDLDTAEAEAVLAGTGHDNESVDVTFGANGNGAEIAAVDVPRHDQELVDTDGEITFGQLEQLPSNLGERVVVRGRDDA